MRLLDQERKDTLEALIDATSLRAVVAAIAEIARNKAEHIRTNWQDNITAQAWDMSASRLEQADKGLHT